MNANRGKAALAQSSLPQFNSGGCKTRNFKMTDSADSKQSLTTEKPISNGRSNR